MRRLLAVAVLLPALLTACGDDAATAGGKLDRSPSVTTRIDAARRLGDLGSPEASALLVRHGLRDPVPAVRAASVAALGDFDDARLVDVLGDRLDDPAPEVQAAAARALGRLGSPQARRYLEVGYARATTSGRVAIAEVLVSLGGLPERAVEEAARSRLARNVEALRTGSVAERVGAAEALGRAGTPEAVAALLPLLASRSVAVASAAARGLGLARERGAVETLGRLLEEPYAELQASAAEALGRIGDPVAVPMLQAALKGAGARQAEPVVAALEAIAGSGGLEATDALCDTLTQPPSVAVAATAARALRRLGAPCDPAEALGRALSGGEVRRRAALHAVVGLGHKALDEAGRQRLRGLLDDRDPDLRALAWQAAAAARLPDAGDAALAGLEAAVEADAVARERWVEARLPQDDAWGIRFLSADAPMARDDLRRLLGLRSSRGLSRHQALLEKVAAYRARREGEALVDGTSGERLSGEDAARAAHLAALTGEDDPVGVELFPQQRSGEVRLLAALAEAGGALAGAAAVPGLQRLVNHPDPGVRMSAVGGLAAIDTPEATQALVDVVHGDHPWDVVAVAVEGLGSRHAAVGAVADRLDRLPPEALPAVARALGEGGEGAREVLVRLLPGTAAPEAAEALGRLGGPEANEALVRHLLLGSPAGRLEAVSALARVGEGGRVARVLREALHDVRPEVRAAAARGIRRLGLADPWLEALRRDYDRRVREAVDPTLKG